MLASLRLVILRLMMTAAHPTRRRIVALLKSTGRCSTQSNRRAGRIMREERKVLCVRTSYSAEVQCDERRRLNTSSKVVRFASILTQGKMQGKPSRLVTVDQREESKVRRIVRKVKASTALPPSYCGRVALCHEVSVTLSKRCGRSLPLLACPSFCFVNLSSVTR